MRAFLLCIALLSSVAPSVARAQEQPSTIPTALAVALLDRGESASGNRSPMIVVGRAPSGIPESLTAVEGGVVLGGVDFVETATVVLTFTRPPNQVIVALDKQLAARGWRPPPPPSSSQRGGFVSAGYGYDLGSAYCGDSGTALVSYAPAPKGGTYLKINHSRTTERGICSPRRQLMISQELQQLEFPRLLPPNTMMQRGGGGCSGGRDTEISTRLEGPLGVADVAAHYLKQLDSAGWKPTAPVTSGDVTLSSLSTKSSQGQQWIGMLIASRVGTEIDVAIRMARIGER